MSLSSIIREELGLSYINCDIDDRSINIHFKQDIELVHFRHSFSDQQFIQRLQQPNQLLLKACNNKKRTIKNVLDLTSGWGVDSFLMAYNGRRVTMLEQNRLVHAITKLSLENAAGEPCLAQTLQRLESININCLDYLRALKDASEFDCVYIDPMFPSHKSGAKPSKGMQLLQLMTNNIDIESAFELALQKAKNRVVVKRPLKSSAFSDLQPDLVYKEKTIRFEVYLTSR